MSINPNIPLAAQAPQIRSPLESATRAMSLADLMDQRKVRQIQLQDTELKSRQFRQQVEDEAAVRTTFQRHAMPGGGVDLDAVVDDLERQGRPGPAANLRKQMFDQRKSFADNLKTTIENETKQLGVASQMLQGVRDTSGLLRARDFIAKNPALGPEYAKLVPDVYDKATVDQLVAQGMEHAAYLTKLRDASNAYKDFLDGKAKGTAVLSQWLSAGRTPQEYAALYQKAAQGGFNADDLALFPTPERWTPQTPDRIAAMGMTPEQRAAQAGQAAGRAETRRHNLQGEVAETTRQSSTTAAQASALARDVAADEQAATKWEQDEYSKLEDRVRTGIPTKDQYNRVTYRQMTPQEINQEHARIEAGYQALRPKAVTIRPGAASEPGGARRAAELMDQIRRLQAQGQDFSKQLDELKAIRARM